MEKTLAIIKPDAVRRQITGDLIIQIERGAFRIVDMKMVYMDEKHAAMFYEEHKGKPFFERLVEFMASGPCVFLVLEKKNAIADWRKLMGPTSIEEAQKDEHGPYSLRSHFGKVNRPLHENVVHGSDSPESAVRELTLFYDDVFYFRGG